MILLKQTANLVLVLQILMVEGDDGCPMAG